MDPVTGLGLFKTISEAGKAIADVAKNVKEHETKVKLNEVYDTLISLKEDAASLEDENRELKEKLRFKSDEFEFKNPFWYEKKYPDRPLCPKCFSDERIAPMSKPVRTTSAGQVQYYCYVCKNTIYD